MLRALFVLAGISGCWCGSSSAPPPPTVIAQAQGVVNAVAVDDAHLYAVSWHGTNRGFIERVPLGGGAAEELATEEGAPKIAVFHDGRLYWDNGYEIKRIAAAGGPVEIILAQGRGDASIAVDDRHVYYIGNAQLHRVPLTGGEAEMVAEDVGTHVALFGDWAYWSDFDGVSRVHKTERRVEELATGATEALSIDGDFVYFCRQFAELHRVPKDGGTDEKLDAGCSDDLLVVDGVSYWTDTTYGEGATHLSVGVVWRQAPGRAREELYRGDLVSNVVVVGDGVYFGAGTKVVRVPRSSP